MVFTKVVDSLQFSIGNRKKKKRSSPLKLYPISPLPLAVGSLYFSLIPDDSITLFQHLFAVTDYLFFNPLEHFHSLTIIHEKFHPPVCIH